MQKINHINGHGLTATNSQPVKTTYQIATEILTGLVRFALVSELPITLCALLVLQGILMALPGVFQ